MTQARPPARGHTEERFRSERARRLNRGGLHTMVAAVVIAGFTAMALWGGGGKATPFHLGALALVGVLGLVAFVALVVARRFERSDRARASAAFRQRVAVAYRDAAPRVPVGLPQPGGPAPNSARS